MEFIIRKDGREITPELVEGEGGEMNVAIDEPGDYVETAKVDTLVFRTGTRGKRFADRDNALDRPARYE